MLCVTFIEIIRAQDFIKNNKKYVILINETEGGQSFMHVGREQNSLFFRDRLAKRAQKEPAYYIYI